MRREKGQGLAEFALLLPVFLLAVMMIVDIGRAVYYYSVVYNAAREGARSGVINPDPANVDSAAMRLASGILKDTNINSKVIYVFSPSGDSYEAIEVTVSYEFAAATPFLARLTGSSTNKIMLRSRATMHMER